MGCSGPARTNHPQKSLEVLASQRLKESRWEKRKERKMEGKSKEGGAVGRKEKREGRGTEGEREQRKDDEEERGMRCGHFL